MVHRLKLLAFCGVIAAIVGTAVPTSAVIVPERTMYITFSRSVALPGVELAAGTYIFELALPSSDLSVVQVLSKDRHHIYLTAFTNVVDRPSGLRAGQVISFGESAAGQAPPIKTWFPADGSSGREFRYRN